MRRATVGLAAALLAAGAAAAQERGEPGDFDFYVLALSWSPNFCLSEPGAADSQQCREGAGFGLIVHGLWPQYEDGYPEYCSEGIRVPESVAAEIADLMPDRRLVFHTWRKHGTCSGLSPEDYFALSREAWGAVAIPDEFDGGEGEQTLSARLIEAAFVGVNPDLSSESIAVACDDGRFEEVRICMTRDLAFRDCADVDSRGCRQNGLEVPAPE